MDHDQKEIFRVRHEIKSGADTNAKISHEAKLNSIIEKTVASLLGCGGDLLAAWFENEIQDVKERHQKAITPNLQEEIKLLSVCISLLEQDSLPEQVFLSASDLILEVLANPTLSSNIKLRLPLLSSLSKLMNNLSEP